MISAKKVFYLIILLLGNTVAALYIYKYCRHDILEGVQNAAIYLRSLPYSPLIMVLLTCICANPPMFGHAFSTTMCGYIFGFAGGFLPAAFGTFLGGLLTLTMVRRLNFGRLVRKLSAAETFDAMSTAISQGGFKMAFLIRICPLPWQVSSSVLSLCDALSFKTYCLASFSACFKTSIEVWIGSQLANLTDATLPPEAHRVAMISMGVGLITFVIIAIWLYKVTMQQVQTMQRNDSVVPEDQMSLLQYTDDDAEQSSLLKISNIV